jgi:hypothetical protein
MDQHKQERQAAQALAQSRVWSAPRSVLVIYQREVDVQTPSFGFSHLRETNLESQKSFVVFFFQSSTWRACCTKVSHHSNLQMDHHKQERQAAQTLAQPRVWSAPHSVLVIY